MSNVISKRAVSKFAAASLLAAAVSPVFCSEARAASAVVSWTAGSGSWSTPANWSSATVPLPGTYVNISHNDSLNRLITFDSSYTDPLGQLVIDQTGAGTTTFAMSSGTIGTRFNTSDEQMLIGLNGRGTFVQTGGTNIGLGPYGFYYQVHLGENAGSAGTYNLSGGTLTGAGLLNGVAGAGTFIQSAGVASFDFGYIGTTTSSFGRMDLSGTAAFFCADIFIAQGGTAVVNQTGGTWQTYSHITLGSSNGSAAYNLSNGTFLAGTVQMGSASSLFNQTGGTARLINLNIASGNWSIAGGSLNVSNEADLGSYTATFGKMSINSGANVSANYLALGSLTNAAGLVELNNATLTSFEESIGFAGAGTVQQNSGTHVVQRLFIGDDPTGSGTYNLGGGTLSVGDEYVGGLGTGVFNQTGGRHTVGKALTVADVGQYGCAYNLSGGTLSALELINGQGAFNQTGGVATFANGIAGGYGTVSVSGTGKLSIARIDQSALNVGTGGFVKLSSGGVAPQSVNYLHDLNISGTSGNWAGKWDLNNNELVLDYSFLPSSPLARVRDYIAGAYAGGNWTGNGLASSAAAAQATSPHRTALGYVEAATLFTSFPAVWQGAVIEPTSILVRYTYAGDANLDGGVDLTDFTFLASNFNKQNNAIWINGDFNYDGTVDLTDFTLLAANFNQTLSGSLGATVPEPSSLTVMTAGAVAWTLRAPRYRRKARGSTSFARR